MINFIVVTLSGQTRDPKQIQNLDVSDLPLRKINLTGYSALSITHDFINFK